MAPPVTATKGIQASADGLSSYTARMVQTKDIDRLAVRRQFARRAGRLAQANFLLREAESQMLSRLDLIKMTPASIVEIGSGLGDGLLALRKRYPEASLLGVDVAEPLVRHARQRLSPPADGFLARLLDSTVRRRQPLASLAVADGAQMPLRDYSAELIWSNLCLHWFDDPVSTVAEWHRIIRPDGLLMFSMFGVDTLKELRAGGAELMQFHDMHDLGDALVAAGFADPVMDMSIIKVAFSSADKAIEDLRSMGGNALLSRRKGLAGREQLRRWRLELSQLRDKDGAIPVTFEIIYGHAWCPSRKRLPGGLQPVEFHRRPAAD